MDREQERQWTQRLMVAKMVESHAEARRIIREVRAAALEEAAKVCATKEEFGDCADAITALAAKEPK